MSEKSPVAVSADEIALYDRQIRLWGLVAQNRMRNANVLVINVGAVANEVIKNIVLAGIGSLTIIDSHDVHPNDLGAQFLVSDQDIGSNRAEAAKYRISRLNPRVAINIEKIALEDIDSNFLSQFEVLVATELKYSQMKDLNSKARQADVKFYAAGLFGLYGYVFADLISHEFRIEREKPNVPTKTGPETKTREITNVSVKKEGSQYMETITKVESYLPLSDSIARATANEAFASGLNTRRKLRIAPLLPVLLAYWTKTVDSGVGIDFMPFKDQCLEMARKLGLPAGIVQDEFIINFLRSAGCEIAPVSAVIGGVLGQEVLNVLGHKEQPIQNLFLFDGDTSNGPIYVL